MGIFRLKLRVKVVASILGIVIAMQPLARRRKAAISLNGNRHLTLGRNPSDVEAFTVVGELIGC